MVLYTHVIGMKTAVALTDSLTTSAVIEPSPCVVSLESADRPPDTFDAPVTVHLVILEPAAGTVTSAGGVPDDEAASVH